MAGLSLLRNKINLTALYAHSHDRIYWQTFRSEETPDVFYTKPVNINGQGVWGFGAEWMESPAKWWRFKLSGRIEITPENTTLDRIHYNKTRFKGQRRSSVARVLTKYPADAVHEERQVRDTVQL